MSYCPKCGSKISEEMAFCPKCGAALKVEQAPAEARAKAVRRDEKGEKAEKREKSEKAEKREKGEYGFLGPLVGGLILIFVGLAFYLRVVLKIETNVVWAFFFIIVGIVIIVLAAYGAMTAGRRHPKTT